MIYAQYWGENANTILLCLLFIKCSYQEISIQWVVIDINIFDKRMLKCALVDGFYTYMTIENNTCYRIAHRGFAFLCKITQFFFFLSTKVDYTLCVWPAERWVDHQTLNHLDISMVSINYYLHILLQSPWLIVIYYNLLEKYLNNLYRNNEYFRIY